MSERWWWWSVRLHLGDAMEPVGGYVLLRLLVMDDEGHVVQIDERGLGFRFHQVQA